MRFDIPIPLTCFLPLSWVAIPGNVHSPKGFPAPVPLALLHPARQHPLDSSDPEKSVLQKFAMGTSAIRAAAMGMLATNVVARDIAAIHVAAKGSVANCVASMVANRQDVFLQRKT